MPGQEVGSGRGQGEEARPEAHDRRPRLEDHELLLGRAVFTEDLPVAGLLHARMVRSTCAHAQILCIETADARNAPGVVGVYTAKDLRLPKLSFAIPGAPISDDFGRPPMADDAVRFVGEIVAIVVAASPAQAADAAELVMVDYEQLPVVVGIEEALAPSAVPVFSAAGGNIVAEVPFESGVRPESDLVTIRQRVVNHRVAVAPMEGEAILVVPGEPDGLRIHAATQTPHSLRDGVAVMFDLSPDSVYVATPAVGGGFGGKIRVSAEYAITVAAALRCGRPLRWVQQRDENLTSMHGRDHLFDIEVEASASGDLRSIRVDCFTNVGAYPGFGCFIPLTARGVASGPYDPDYLSFNIHYVTTHTAPTGAFRGAGRPEATDILERAADMLAVRLGIDPAEIRRRNLIQKGRFPFRSLTGVTYDSGDYLMVLDRALELAGYSELRTEQLARRRAGDSRYMGIGLSTFVELSGAGAGLSGEYASVEVLPDGNVSVGVGTAAHGQGHRTVFTDLVCELLGVDRSVVRFVDGDTRLVARGVGTGGSRSAQLGGSAVVIAAEAVLDKGRILAAHLLEAAVEDIEVFPGKGLGVRGTPRSALSWGTLAGMASEEACLPLGMKPGLFADPGFEMDTSGTAPFGCHVAVVEVDAETGRVDLERFVAVDDCGVLLNERLAEGQVHGGVFAGISQALFEVVAYDDDGNPVTSSFADYRMPSAADVPSYESTFTCTPSPRNPLGAKGIGEAGTTGSLAAVHNAVVDAVAHLGVTHIDLPLSPERVWRAINSV